MIKLSTGDKFIGFDKELEFGLGLGLGLEFGFGLGLVSMKCQ